MLNLKDKKILLGITGGIAAYKACELIRIFVMNGAEVRIIMTKSAQEFITPLTLETLSKNKVYTTTFEHERLSNIEHVALARWADCFLIAPATANIMAKMAHGIADDLLSTTYLATSTSIPICIAPAMNREMWLNPATQSNLQILKTRNIKVFGPSEGIQACGESGLGRMLEPLELAQMTAQVFMPHLLKDKKVIVTAGPTIEAIDPVRFISNRSSGKMGYAIAEAAASLGADVILISGPTHLSAPCNVQIINIKTAEEMYKTVMENIQGCNMFISTAAVADYRMESIAEQKLKKGLEKITLSLVKNPDILASVASLDKPPLTVGFAAETENIISNAQHKLESKRIDIIAANKVGEHLGFESDQNTLTILTKSGEVFELSMRSKNILAHDLMRYIIEYQMRN